MCQALCNNVCLVSWNFHDSPAASGLLLYQFTDGDLGQEVKPFTTNHRGSKWYWHLGAV